MKVLRSEGFINHKSLVKFVADNNMPLENIYSIVAEVGAGYNIVLFYWIER